MVCSYVQIVLLLRLVPLLPFNVLNYLLSVTPISNASYILATWFGVMVRLLNSFSVPIQILRLDFNIRTKLGFDILSDG